MLDRIDKRVDSSEPADCDIDSHWSPDDRCLVVGPERRRGAGEGHCFVGGRPGSWHQHAEELQRWELIMQELDV